MIRSASAGAVTACAQLLVIGACGRDVRLGSTIDAPAAIDAHPDAPGNPFTAGAYTASFLDPVMIQSCTGSLGSDENDFMAVTRASVDLVDGEVTLATPDAATLAMSGTPITSGWAQTTLDLTLASTAPDPPLWAAEINQDFGSGPDGTTRGFMGLALDVDTAQSQSGIEGEVGIAFETGSDSCTLAFGALFVKM